jgi:hypothetical protein
MNVGAGRAFHRHHGHDDVRVNQAALSWLFRYLFLFASFAPNEEEEA